MRATAICLFLILLTLALACGDDADEPGISGDDALTAEELLDEMRRGSGATESDGSRMDSISLGHNLDSQETEWDAQYEIQIEAGDLHYVANGVVPKEQVSDRCSDAPDSACLTALMEFCREAKANCPYDATFGETLSVGDVDYRRLSDGTWSDEQSGCDENGWCWSNGTTDFAGAYETCGDGTDGEFSIFDLMVDPMIVDDAPEGEIHIRASVVDLLNHDWQDSCASPEPTTEAPTPDVELTLDLPGIPDRSEGTIDYWVDANDHRPLREEMHSEYFQGEELVIEAYALFIFSDSTAAEIPGPLPD